MDVAPAADRPAPASIRELVDRYYRPVFRTLRRLGVAESSAEDAAQMVFAVVARRLDGISPGAERAFLFRTAWRVAADVRRSVAVRAPELLDEVTMEQARDPGPTPEQHLEDARARELLDRLLDALPFELRTVLVLVEIEEMTLVEVAALLAVPLGTATSRLRRARELFEAASKRVRAKGGSR